MAQPTFTYRTCTTDEFFEHGILDVDCELLDAHLAVVLVGPTRLVTLPSALLGSLFGHAEGTTGYRYRLRMGDLAEIDTSTPDP